MANLIIQENGTARTYPAVNGEEITIQAPCDCTNINGVQIEDEVFPFYDACGKKIAGVGDLFSANSLVRVLIDTVNKRATILNRGITPANIGATPTSRKVNGKALSSDITLSASDVGAAPAGFGYGGAMTSIDLTSGAYSGMTLSAALDSVLATMVSGSAAQIQLRDPNGEYSYRCFGKLWKYGSSNGGNATLEVVTYNGHKAFLRRLSDRGWLTEWEWENPPMTTGVEYRTLERFAEKPVYVKSFKVTTANKLEIPVTEGYRIFRVDGFVKTRGSLPVHLNNFSTADAYSCYVKAESEKLTMYCGSSCTGKDAWITAFYVKTTE